MPDSLHSLRQRLSAPVCRVGLILVLAAAGGCSSVGTIFGGGDRVDAPAPAADVAATRIVGNGVGIYLEAMHALASDDPVQQSDAYREAADALSRSPTTTNRLRMALIHATPGHAWSNAADAQRLLNQLLASGNTLLPEERVLAEIFLNQAEQVLMLDAEAAQLRSRNAAALEQQQSANARQLAAALEENRRLRAELEDALERLDAIANIERSIRERENGSDAPP